MADNSKDELGYVERAERDEDGADMHVPVDQVVHYLISKDTELPSEFPIPKTTVKDAREFCNLVSMDEICIVSVLDDLSLSVLLKYPSIFGVKAARLVGVPGESKYDAGFDAATWALPLVTFESLRAALQAGAVAEALEHKPDARMASTKPDFKSQQRVSRPAVTDSDIPEFGDDAES